MGLNLGNDYNGAALGSLDDRTILHLACFGSDIELHVIKLHRSILYIHTYTNECIYNR